LCSVWTAEASAIIFAYSNIDDLYNLDGRFLLFGTGSLFK